MTTKSKEQRLVNIELAEPRDLLALDNLNPVGLTTWQSEFWNKKMQPSFVFTARDFNRITGVEGYIGGYNLIRQGRSFPSHRSERTLVLPEMRGMGVFKKLIDACHNESLNHNSSFCWGATSAVKPFERVGFKGFTKWRKYHFIPLGDTFYHSWFKSGSAVFKTLWRLKQTRSFHDFLDLGGLMAGLIPSKKSKSNLEVRKVKFEQYELLAKKVLSVNQRKHDDFALHVTANLLFWLKEKGIDNTCFEIMDEKDTPVGGFIIRRTKHFFIMQDWFHSDSCSSQKFFHAVRKSLFTLSKTKKSEKPLNTMIYALNTTNGYHQQLSKIFPLLRIDSPLVGSFVIKSAAKSAEITQLRINPIWLDL